MDTREADDVIFSKRHNWDLRTNGVTPTSTPTAAWGEPYANHRMLDSEPPTPSPPAYAVRMLHRDRLDDWAWHPYVMLRIIRFFEEQEPQGDPHELVRNVQQSFTLDDPGLMVIAFFMDDALIGHILCDRAMLYLKPLVTVHQYALDHGIPSEIRKEAVQLIKDWGKYRGPDGAREPATFIQWLVNDKRLVPLYKRVFRAKAHMLLMRLPIEEDSHG